MKTLALGGFGTAVVLGLGIATLGLGGISDASPNAFKVTMTSSAGIRLGTVSFVKKQKHTEVVVKLQFPVGSIGFDMFHGMHLHANNDPANGVGCISDPTQQPTTWFVAADGHWKIDGQDHGSHHGDLPSIYVGSDGAASGSFRIAQLDFEQLKAKVLIVHANADNFGNIPVGIAPNQYTPNSDEALILTKNTGNGGARLACGLVD